MLNRLLTCWLVLGVLCFGAAAGPPDDPHGLQPIIEMAATPGVDVNVVWKSCGQRNAYYVEATKTVELCTELVGMPDLVIQFYLTHELSHGIIEQLDLPFTGNEEYAADELAMVMLHMMGRDDVLKATSAFLTKRAWPEDPKDSHPGDLRRANNMAAFAKGGYAYEQAANHWARLLIPAVQAHGGI
jgi:hypothetical protein